MKELFVYFDGACEPHNPGGIATWGIAVYDSEKNPLHTDCGLACMPFSKQSTNNYAEYSALIKALQYCIEVKAESVSIFGDSQLVVKQMQGLFKVKSPNILPLYEQAVSLTKGIKKVKITWVPREQNAVADKMSKQAYEDELKKSSSDVAIEQVESSVKIKTAHIRAKVSGIRLVITFKDNPEHVLSPPKELVYAYKYRNLPWQEYASAYRQLLEARYKTRKAEFDSILADAKREGITLVCYCTDESKCHRTLAKEFLEKIEAESQP